MNLQITEQELELINEQGSFQRPIDKCSFEAFVFKYEMISKFVIKKDFDKLKQKDINKAFEGNIFRTLLAFNEFKSVSVEDQTTIYTDIKILVSEDSKNFLIYLE